MTSPAGPVPVGGMTGNGVYNPTNPPSGRGNKVASKRSPGKVLKQPGGGPPLKSAHVGTHKGAPSAAARGVKATASRAGTKKIGSGMSKGMPKGMKMKGM